MFQPRAEAARFGERPRRSWVLPGLGWVRQARRRSRQPSDPTAILIVVSGLSAAGKSTIASRLAQQIRAAHVRIDTIEQAVVEARSVAQPLGPVGYLIGYAVAADQLRNGLSVVADSVNPLAVTRSAWRHFGARHAVRTVEMKVICSDPGWQQILDREYKPWDHPRLIIDTAHADVDACITSLRLPVTTQPAPRRRTPPTNGPISHVR